MVWVTDAKIVVMLCELAKGKKDFIYFQYISTQYVISGAGGVFIFLKSCIISGFSGCSKYFPTDVGETQVHGNYKVTCDFIRVENDDFIERELSVATVPQIDEKTTKNVTHLQFKTWPNYGVPQGNQTKYPSLFYMNEILHYILSILTHIKKLGPKAIAGFIEHVRDCTTKR